MQVIVAHRYQPQIRREETLARDTRASSYALISSASNLPHPEKIQKGGEDAWFVKTSEHGGGVIIVSDGVGGANEFGIDPGLYARVLSYEVARAHNSSKNPKAMLAAAQRETKLVGAATVCVVEVEGGRLRAANVGDSGFRVIRAGDIVLASEARQHEYQMPYQLMYQEMFRGTDTADDADSFDFPVEPGDIVVVGSDGLFNNVFDDDIARIATEAAIQGRTSLTATKAASEALLKLARMNAEDPNCESPYALEKWRAVQLSDGAASLFKRRPRGGKLDDITVVVGMVASSASASTDLKEAVAAYEKLSQVVGKEREEAKEYEARIAQRVNERKKPGESGTNQTEDLKRPRNPKARPRETYKGGRAMYKPDGYQTICDEAAQSVAYGLDDGLKLLEVEFPPLPGEGAAGAMSNSDAFIDYNVQFALQVANMVHKDIGKTVQVLLPDNVELQRAKKKFGKSMKNAKGISLGELEGSANIVGKMFSKGDELSCNADAYVIVGLDARALPRVETFFNSNAKGAPIVFFNNELDTLRGDLGVLPFGPDKDLHYRFLSRIKPVYYIRARDYSKSTATPPYNVIRYSGALFREYPGPWQVMIKRGDADFASVAEGAKRYTLGEAKNEMLKSIGQAEDEGSVMKLLREGVTANTWWEEQNEYEQSQDWRT